LPEPLLRFIEALRAAARRTLEDPGPSTVGTVDVLAAVDKARTLLAAAQARVCQAACGKFAAAQLAAKIAERDGARANLAKQLRSAQSQLRQELAGANLLEVRKLTSELEQLLLAARATVSDEAALMAAPMETSQDSLQGHLAKFDEWVASLSTQGEIDFARDALLIRLSEIFIDCDASRDIDRLVLQLFRMLEAESSLAARRACWVESIPLRPLLRAAEQRIERHSVLCGVLEQQQALLSQVERELLAAELVMAPATQEQIRAKVCEIKVAKTALETAIMYDLPDARAIEKKVANAERDGETSVTLGRNGSETLGIAEAKQRAQELRAAVRKASKAVDSASSELASEVNAFPELIVNICGPEVVLPADLVSLWRTGWTLESIEDVKLIASPSDVKHPSRSIIYRGRITSLSGQQYRLPSRNTNSNEALCPRAYERQPFYIVQSTHTLWSCLVSSWTRRQRRFTS
jgi:hypothetical protein